MSDRDMIRCLNCDFAERITPRGRCSNCNIKNWGRTDFSPPVTGAAPGDIHPVLLIPEGQVFKYAFPVKDNSRFLIGRAGDPGSSGEVAIKLSDQKISRVHATLERKGNHIYIRDGFEKKSTNGTFVNGHKISSNETEMYRLKDQDVIQVGSKKIVFLHNSGLAIDDLDAYEKKYEYALSIKKV